QARPCMARDRRDSESMITAAATPVSPALCSHDQETGRPATRDYGAHLKEFLPQTAPDAWRGLSPEQDLLEMGQQRTDVGGRLFRKRGQGTPPAACDNSGRGSSACGWSGHHTDSSGR